MLDVDTGRTLSDQLKWVKFSRVSWTPDGKGFYYSRYDEPPPGETIHRAELLPEALLPPARRAAGAGHAGL